MILKFFEHGEGSGKAAIDYVYDDKDHEHNTRYAPPQTILGDPAITKKLIDNCGHKFKYKSGMLSFTREEYTDDIAAQALKDFEATAFAGMEKHQYDLLLVKHEEEKDIHFHFVSPRMELTTGKSYNICTPDQAQQFWSVWSELERGKLGLKEPPKAEGLDKLPLSSKEYKLYKKGLINKMPQAKQKLELHAVVENLILLDLITNRRDVITFFKECGYDISRVEKNYVSIRTGTDPNSRPLKFTGRIYEDETDRYGTTYSEIADRRGLTLERSLESEEQTITHTGGRNSIGGSNGVQKGLEIRHRKALERHIDYVKERYGRTGKFELGKNSELLFELQKRASTRNEEFRLAKRSTERGNISNSSGSSLKSVVNTVDNYNGKIQELTEKLALTTDPEVKARIQTQLSGLTGHRADDFVSVMLGKGKGHII